MYKQANVILIMATHHSLDASSLQSHFRGNDKDYVKHVSSTGQRK